MRNLTAWLTSQHICGNVNIHFLFHCFECIVYVWCLCDCQKIQWQFRYGSLSLWCKRGVFFKMKNYKNFLSNHSNLEFLSRNAVTGFIQFSGYVVILSLHQWKTDILKTDTTLFLEGINRIAKLKLVVHESVHRDATMKITNKVHYID
jgi:hypothetical protein